MIKGGAIGLFGGIIVGLILVGILTMSGIIDSETLNVLPAETKFVMRDTVFVPRYDFHSGYVLGYNAGLEDIAPDTTPCTLYNVSLVHERYSDISHADTTFVNPTPADTSEPITIIEIYHWPDTVFTYDTVYVEPTVKEVILERFQHMYVCPRCGDVSLQEEFSDWESVLNQIGLTNTYGAYSLSKTKRKTGLAPPSINRQGVTLKVIGYSYMDSEKKEVMFEPTYSGVDTAGNIPEPWKE